MRLRKSLLSAALSVAVGIAPAAAGDGSVRVQTRQTGLLAAGAGEHVQLSVSNRGDSPVETDPCWFVCVPVLQGDRVGGSDGVQQLTCGPDSRELDLPAVQIEPHADVVWVLDLDALALPRDARGRVHLKLEANLADPPEPGRNRRVRFADVLHTIEVFDGATGETSNYFGSSELVTRGGE